MPAVTVGLPIYNSERFLAEAVESIKAQTFRDYEVIAILDGCTDRSDEILDQLKDERFVILRNQTNLGVLKTLNCLLNAASAPLFARMDADDVMDPHRLELQVEFLNAHPQVDVLGTRCTFIDEAGRQVRRFSDYPLTHEDIRARFRRSNVVVHPTVMFRTEKIRALGGYDAEFVQAEDLALWLKCLAGGLQFAALPEKLLYYRVHPGQTTLRKMRANLDCTELAYDRFGPAIWGNNAPRYVAATGPVHRIWRRFRRLFL